MDYTLMRPASALLLVLLTAVSLTACGEHEDSDESAGPSDATTSAPSPGQRSDSGDQGTAVTVGTPIRITFAETELAARLHDNAAGRDLAAQLPLTLTFRDHNDVEKTAPLPRELSRDGAPEAHDPAAGDIGYWAPDGDLVFYYDDDAPAFSGIVRIGEFESKTDAIERQRGGFSVTIDRARHR